MTEDNTKTSVNKNNEIIRNKETEANSWIMGVSKSHPGQKYYFNIVTGVSLWNISDEDIERAQQRMKASGSPFQYVNYPEPKEPPPNRRMSSKVFNQIHCQHSLQTQRPGTKHLITNELSSDVSYNHENYVCCNCRSCHHTECTSQPLRHINVMLQSRMKSPPLLDSRMFESNATQCAQHNNTSKHLMAGRRSPKRHIAESIAQDNDETHSQSSYDNEWHEGNNSESVDLALLKKFAKSDAFEDKWYIIADASVFLQDINTITTILDTDEKCCLIITQNVKIELKNATKTPLKAKAYYANYIICKLLHLGLAVTDDDILKENQDITNNTRILNCCLKLKEQNYYVVVITNDVELEKYGQFHVPIFTLRELKKCSNKSNHFVSNSPRSLLAVPQYDNKCKLSTPNIIGIFSNIKIPDKFNMKRTNSDLSGEENSLHTQSLLEFNGNSTRSSLDFKDVNKTTTDAEVQTDLTLLQLQEMECIYRKTCLTKHIDSSNKETEALLSYSQTYESSLDSTNRGPSKHIKLKRWKSRDQSILQNQVNVSISHTTTNNTVKNSSPTCNILENIDIEDQNKSSSNIFFEYKSVNKETPRLDKSSNRTIQEIHNKKCNEDINQSMNQKQIGNNDNIEDKNVMFEITTEKMEESLKTNCDEWVKKFVQIMEKALTEVLRKISLRISPWNLYKATMYIEENIRDDADIVDASTKLLNVLNQVKNEEDGITTDMSPNTYMKMYSFGVYLIDALQGKFDTCDDLQIAAESISTLLSDIQNPNLDTDNDKVEVLMIIDTDSVSDEIFENTDKQEDIEGKRNGNKELIDDVGRKNNAIDSSRDQHIETTCLSNNVSNEDNTEQFKVNIPYSGKTLNCDQATFTGTLTKSTSRTKCIGSPSTYNLRSRQRRLSEEANEYLTKEDNNINKVCKKRLFLSNFQLESNPKHDGSDPLHTTKEVAKDVQSHNIENKEHLNQDINNAKLLHEVDAPNREQKVVRNFVKCLEFEERLRSNEIQDELNDLDYEHEDMETEDIDELCDTRRDVSEEIPDLYDCEENYSMDYEVASNKENIKIDLKYIITKIAKEIREISSEVYAFSSRAKRSFLSASEDKNDVREKAGNCYLYINKLCTALNSILYRDRNGTYNIQAMLDTTEFADVCVDEDQMEVYGDFISSCLEQAQNLKEVIKDVLSALNMNEETK